MEGADGEWLCAAAGGRGQHAMREKRKASGTATPAQRPAQTGGATSVQAVSDRPVRNRAVRT